MQAAELVGTTHQSFQQWELKANLQVNKLPAVARALGVTPAELVPGPIELTADERRLLTAYRAAGEREKRTIFRAAIDLTEPAGDSYKQKPAAAPTKKSRRKT